MKFFFLFLLTALFIGSVYSQDNKIQWMDSVEVKKLESGSFKYFNGSAQTGLRIEGKTDLFVDFALVDRMVDFDYAQVVINSDTFKNESLQPFMIRGLEDKIKCSVMAFKDDSLTVFQSQNVDVFNFTIEHTERPAIVKDEIVFGILALILALIFFTAHKDSPFWKKFYLVIPALLLCYVIPALLVLFGLISPEYSGLYSVSKNYLLPAALILMTLGIDFKAILNLGSKAIIMFVVGTIGVIIGGPIAIMVYSLIDPSVVGGEGFEAAWRGMATIAGSWIGGGANQAAMYETYEYAPQLYGKMIVVDIVVANLWMAFLLFGASRADKIDKWLKADSSAIENLKKRVTTYQESIAKQPTLTDYMVILGIAFALVATGHILGKEIADGLGNVLGEDSPLAGSFLWLVIIATTGGLILSFTKLRQYEGAGASKIGSVFIYILVASIGMKMELAEAFKEPQLILVGIIWMIVHVSIMIGVAKLIKAPFFFLAVGSQANIGGAASAPVVAAAFHPSLTSVGAIIAVLGYALGTYGAIICAELMAWVAPT